MDRILRAREERSALIKSKLSESSETIIIIKANIIGVDKNPYYALLIINIFNRLIKELFEISNTEFFESLDGPFYLLRAKVKAEDVKLKCIDLEEKHLLGRLVDIDVYFGNGSLSRKQFNRGFRKCLVCSEDAVICMRMMSHTLEEIREKENQKIKKYFKKILEKYIDEAITLEANLDPKFGLVTKKTNGSHKDMDYSLLMKSKYVILDDLVEMFFIGFENDLLDGFFKARKLGISTEIKMYEVTTGVNTYKGLIFILGITLVALGFAIKNKRKDLFSLIKIIGKDLTTELDTEVNTFGKFAYINYGFLGARGEVHSGLENVKAAKDILTELSNEALTLTLIHLIKNVEDTVLLKRSKTIDKYKYYKNLVGGIEEYNYDTINLVTDECIKNNISFGGSADLLITTIFIKLIEEELGVIYE